MSEPRTVKWWACGRYNRLWAIDGGWERVEVILMPNMYQPLAMRGGFVESHDLWFSVPLDEIDFYLSDDRMLVAKRALPLFRLELPIQVGRS